MLCPNCKTEITTKEIAHQFGKAGGDKRKQVLSPERRKEIATNAVKARWAKRIIPPILILAFMLLPGCTRYKTITEGAESAPIRLSDPHMPTYTVLLAGQSNMVRISQYASEALKSSIKAHRHVENVVLISCAVGGTWSGQWLPGGGLLEDCVEASKGHHVDAIGYYQGESDAFLGRIDWDVNFTKTITGFRSRLGYIPILFCQIGKAKGDWLRGWAEIQREQAGINIQGVKMIPTEDLVHEDQLEDEVHISASDLQAIAARLGGVL